ncbi:MAG TPA: SDR family oxidoreductase [Xanthomonadaceae bacterium]|nr:SDR family oxidoreductase [Xanthomonadaceae bacterium]
MARILITGANRGIGLEFTRQFLARGDRVVAACRRPGKATELTQLAAAHPGHLHVLAVDMAEPKAVLGLAREAEMIWDSLDLLVNNAGVLHPGEHFGSVAAEDLVRSFAVNAMGPYLLLQALAPMLARGSAPKAVHLSTRLASLAECSRFGTASYAIGKAALNMAMRQAAHGLVDSGVTSFLVSPGWVGTEMGGVDAELKVEDSVAALIALIDRADTAMHGGFFNRMGEAIPW